MGSAGGRARRAARSAWPTKGINHPAWPPASQPASRPPLPTERATDGASKETTKRKRKKKGASERASARVRAVFPCFSWDRLSPGRTGMRHLPRARIECREGGTHPAGRSPRVLSARAAWAVKERAARAARRRLRPPSLPPSLPLPVVGTFALLERRSGARPAHAAAGAPAGGHGEPLDGPHQVQEGHGRARLWLGARRGRARLQGGAWRGAARRASRGSVARGGCGAAMSGLATRWGAAGPGKRHVRPLASQATAAVARLGGCRGRASSASTCAWAWRVPWQRCLPAPVATDACAPESERASAPAHDARPLTRERCLSRVRALLRDCSKWRPRRTRKRTSRRTSRWLSTRSSETCVRAEQPRLRAPYKRAHAPRRWRAAPPVRRQHAPPCAARRGARRDAAPS